VTDSLANPAEVLMKVCPLCGEEISADALVCRCTAPDIPGLVLIQPVGSGGYADVFLYEQQMPRMPVAVKVLKVNLLSSEGLTQRLALRPLPSGTTLTGGGAVAETDKRLSADVNREEVTWRPRGQLGVHGRANGPVPRI
jgi:hypothetical protein